MGPTPRYRAFYDSLAPHKCLSLLLQKTAGDHFVLQSKNDVTSDSTTAAGLLILLKSYDRSTDVDHLINKYLKQILTSTQEFNW